MNRKNRFDVPWRVVGSFLILILCTGESFAREPSPSVQSLIFEALEQFKTLEDYTCTLDKRVLKNGTLYEDRGISVKYKKPGHYYFRWSQGTSRGREVIFVEGKNHDRLLAHPGGIFKFITLHLDPEGSLAMKENRHSLKSSGMEKIISLMESNYSLAMEKGLEVIQCKAQGTLDGENVWIIEGSFPDGHGFYAQKMTLSFSKKLKLPVKISIYDGQEALLEEYVFNDLSINTGVSEKDFDPSNPEYSYLGR